MSPSPTNGWLIFTSFFSRKIEENNPTKGTCPGNLASKDSEKWRDFTYTCANERCNHVPANKLMTWMKIPLVTSAIKLTLVTHNSTLLKHHQKSWARTMHHFEAFRKPTSCTACQEYWPVFFIGHKWWRESVLASFFGGLENFPASELDQPPA